VPIDPIPAAKNAIELLAAVVTQSAGPQVVNLRIATIWGPGDTSRAPVVPNLVHAAVRGEPVEQPVYAADGSDLCYVADCARAIALLQCAETLHHSTYNVGCGRPASPAQVREALLRSIPGAALELTPGRDPGGPGHDTWTSPGCGRTPAISLPTTSTAACANTSAGCATDTRTDDRQQHTPQKDTPR
jgi:UDP-glucose 4-epimerase